MKTVPDIPTEEMLAAVRQLPHPTRPDGWDGQHIKMWQAMLAASPALPTDQREQDKADARELYKALERKDESLITRILNLRLRSDRLERELATALEALAGAREAALEEAARVCETEREKYSLNGLESAACRGTLDYAAKAIRALASKE